MLESKEIERYPIQSERMALYREPPVRKSKKDRG